MTDWSELWSFANMMRVGVSLYASVFCLTKWLLLIKCMNSSIYDGDVATHRWVSYDIVT